VGLTTYTGGCHCGAVRFEVDVEEHRAVECNCSICTKKGFIHLIVGCGSPPDHDASWIAVIGRL
jgi:hypothetical protein